MAEAADIQDWLINWGTTSPDFAGLTDALATKLLGLGVPLDRIMIGGDSLHPTVGGESVRWDSLNGDSLHRYDRGREGQYLNETIMEEWLQSPIYYLVANHLNEMRRRLVGNDGRGEFPLLDDLRDSGFSDYVAFAVAFPRDAMLGETDGMVATFSSRAADGFTDEHLAILRSLMPALGLAFKATWLLRTTRSLMATYLGSDAAERVLAGRISRGQAEPIEAVIWFSDLEGFTRLADRAPREQLLALLNDYAGAIVDAIQAAGGQVLKLIGDGILAIFRAERPEDACRMALDAAQAATNATHLLSDRRGAAGAPTTRCFIGMHHGEVLYGNIGSDDRLDFTVLGPAVNEASRIERMARSLEQPLVVSSVFANVAGPERARLVSLGRYLLRGVGRPQELLTLDPECQSAPPDDKDSEEND